MPQGDSPAGARRRVRLALREARQALGQTQSDVAEAMEWSLSKVQRIEKGDVTVAPNDLRPLLVHLGIKGKERVEELIQAAKLSRQRRQWWDDPKFRQHVTPAMLQLAGYEMDSEEIFLFAPMVLPAVLQTYDYASIILNSFANDVSQANREVRLEFRMRRRSEFFVRANPPQVRAIIDESILYRYLGDRDMHRAQLADLHGLAEKGHVAVRVMPYEITVAVPILGAFDLYYLGGDRTDPEENAIIYRESGDQDEIVDDVEKVRRHRGFIDQWWHASHDEARSMALIEERSR